MLGVFLYRDSLDCGDLDFSDLDRILPHLDYYAATPPEQVAARIAEAEVVISNKVQTILDGNWRSLDGRPLHAATVALSELHEAVFADHLTRMLGVEWESRARGRDRDPARGSEVHQGALR